VATGHVIHRNRYYDSVFLMQVASRLAQESGVEQAAALMGTEANKRLLAELGFSEREIIEAGPNDLIVALAGEDSQINIILTGLEGWLSQPQGHADGTQVRCLEDALLAEPRLNLAAISVPGQYAAKEARRALDLGLNVFLFSSNVPVKDEITLKRRARSRNLLVMGPDCGTAVIGGVGLGFANVVRRGCIGAIAAMGTGLQEFTTQVHCSGQGISHAIGLGGRDLSDAVGGVSAFMALDALEADPDTRVIALLSKPPGPSTLLRLKDRLRRATKPVVGCFLGSEPQSGETVDSVVISRTIDDAAERAIGMVGGCAGLEPEPLVGHISRDHLPEQRFLRGLFAGGTFCYQAQQILRDAGLRVHSNSPMQGTFGLTTSWRSQEHCLVDMGAEEFTNGRPHPMIDASLRRDRILMEGEDPSVAVLLLDFILGLNASPNPAGELVRAIAQAKETAERRGGDLEVFASVCGTDGDPQDLAKQVTSLEGVGVVVFRTAARAAQASLNAIMRVEQWQRR